MPTIDMAVEKTKSDRIGIMATQATIDTHVHKKLLLDRNPDLSIFEQACPDFVPLIEAQASEEELNVAIKKYLDPLLGRNIDTLILGCTHYAFLEKLIQQQAPHLHLVSAANCLVFTSDLACTPKISIQSTGLINVQPFIHKNNY